MFAPRRKTVWPGIKRAKIRMRLKDHVDLPGNPPSRGLGMRKNRRRGGVLGLLVAILRVDAQRRQQARHKESQKQQWKKCSCGRQSLNLTDSESSRLVRATAVKV